MKPINLFAPLFLISFLLMEVETVAQVQQGDVNLGVNSSIQVTSFQGSSITTTSFIFSGQYYVTDNISAGAAPIVAFSGFDFGGLKTTSSTFSLSLFGNYNFLLEGGEFLPYAGASLMFTNTTSTTKGGTGGDTETVNGKVNFGLNGGAKYFINERVNIDGNLSYTFNVSASNKSNGTKVSVDSDGGTFLFTIGLGIILGSRGN